MIVKLFDLEEYIFKFDRFQDIVFYRAVIDCLYRSYNSILGPISMSATKTANNNLVLSPKAPGKTNFCLACGTDGIKAGRRYCSKTRRHLDGVEDDPLLEKLPEAGSFQP